MAWAGIGCVHDKLPIHVIAKIGDWFHLVSLAQNRNWPDEACSQRPPDGLQMRYLLFLAKLPGTPFFPRLSKGKKFAVLITLPLVHGCYITVFVGSKDVATKLWLGGEFRHPKPPLNHLYTRISAIPTLKDVGKCKNCRYLYDYTCQ